ncbi:transcription factor HY5-like isoform X4 [Elaeis guineensis]|uniref:Transcription factor HY5-like isoform X3 n=1 Tax=Elaeis guineensis var. tenera TaxID=51953 RepID=A0A6I9QTI7_ELAGV|nr:transcription factor HY5-like isoform X3 [Elaeis guineensis]
MSLPDAAAAAAAAAASRRTPHPTPPEKDDPEESDDDLFTVPDVESGPSSSGALTVAAEIQQSTSSGGGGAGPSKSRRGRNPADREYRRLKRLLRNRVSAQQARERKKVYVNDLESRAKELHDKNLKLEEKISTLINENTMLRKVLMNTRPKVDEGIETKK